MAVADPYIDPATGCLHNLLGIADPQRLRSLEAALVGEAERDFYARPSLIQATWDSHHWRATHRHLFGDIYPWAGEYRTIDIEKDGHSFHPVARLDQAVAWCTSQLRQAAAIRPALGADDLSAVLSPVLADLNEAHPFREGNGRTQWSLITQAASLHGCTLDWSPVTATENLVRSIASVDDPDAFAPIDHAIIRPASGPGRGGCRQGPSPLCRCAAPGRRW